MGTTINADGFTHAAIWRGTASSYLNLHNFLHPDFTESRHAASFRTGRSYTSSARARHARRAGEALMWVTRCSACTADFNCTGNLIPPNAGAVTLQDIFDYLDAWFLASPHADFDRSGAVTLQDLFDFIGAYFAGCV